MRKTVIAVFAFGALLGGSMLIRAQVPGPTISPMPITSLPLNIGHTYEFLFGHREIKGQVIGLTGDGWVIVANGKGEEKSFVNLSQTSAIKIVK